MSVYAFGQNDKCRNSFVRIYSITSSGRSRSSPRTASENCWARLLTANLFQKSWKSRFFAETLEFELGWTPRKWEMNTHLVIGKESSLQDSFQLGIREYKTHGVSTQSVISRQKRVGHQNSGSVLSNRQSEQKESQKQIRRISMGIKTGGRAGLSVSSHCEDGWMDGLLFARLTFCDD